MTYKSIKEISPIWNLSTRRITVLASTGRIPGAKLVGKTWLIPENAVKPADARYKSENSKENDYFFPLPGFIYDSYETAEKILPKSQLDLFKAQKLCTAGKFAEADVLLTTLLKKTNNICITLGALYFKIFTDIYLNNQESLLNTNSKIQQIDLNGIKNKEELWLILMDMKGILSGNKIYIENFKLNREYDYSPEALPYLVLLETYTSLITAYTTGEKLKPVFQESACIYMKQKKCVFSEITLHLYLAMMYKTSDDIENYSFHMKKAFQLAEKNEIILPYILGFKFMHTEIMEYIAENQSSLIAQVPEIAQTFNKNSEGFLQKIDIQKMYYNLSSHELDLIEDARSGLTNKEIAKSRNISESYVSKQYFELCKKTGASSKRELVEMFIENMKL